jgi:hypothetical protein
MHRRTAKRQLAAPAGIAHDHAACRCCREPTMNRIPIALIALLSIAGCAPMMTGSAVRPATTGEGTLDYRAFTTGPVMAADFRRISDWSSPDPQHVVLWNTPNRAYLVTLSGPCMALQNAATIGVTGGQLARAGRESIVVQGERCPIWRIDRLDTRRLNEARGR